MHISTCWQEPVQEDSCGALRACMPKSPMCDTLTPVHTLARQLLVLFFSSWHRKKKKQMDIKKRGERGDYCD